MNNLSTTFVANFTSFYQAAEKATVHLEQIAVDSDKVQKALNRTAASFTGDRLIREATLSARALDQMGGASILTAKEAERLGKSYDEAIRKMQAMGVVCEVVPDAETISRALALAQQIAELPPLAVQQIKEIILAGEDGSLDEGLRLEAKAIQLMFSSQDQKEGMAAFIEKRKPKFQGK